MGLSENKLPVMEEFVTIQGEGVNIGKPYYFIRVGGCPLRCNFCDTEASWTAEATWIKDVEEVAKRAIETCAANGIEWVSITGGEPMIYPKQMMQLIDALHRHPNPLNVHIETSGRFHDEDVHGACDIYSVDAKTPCTGEAMEGFFKGMRSLRTHDQVKCLISDETDMDYAFQVNQALGGHCTLVLQPFNMTIPTDSTKNMDDRLKAIVIPAGEEASVARLRRELAVGLRHLIQMYQGRTARGEVWKNTVITPQIHVLAFGNTPAT